jgi:hypothetical protein
LNLVIQPNQTILYKRLSMVRLILFFVLAVFVVSCKKVVEPEEEFIPKMNYLDLSDTALVFGGRTIVLDLDGNGEKDVLFGTQLVGDPINQQDKRQWLVTVSFYANLAINSNGKMPVMRRMDVIPIANFSGYEWYNANEALLAQRVEDMSGAVYWEGDWKQSDHHYIPIQVNRNNALYNGWIEVSFSISGEKLILHKAAICQVENRPIAAGL